MSTTKTTTLPRESEGTASTVPRDASGRRALLRRLGRGVDFLLPILGFALIALLVTFLEIAVRHRWLNTVYFPAPSRVFETFVELGRSGALVKETSVRPA